MTKVRDYSSLAGIVLLVTIAAITTVAAVPRSDVGANNKVVKRQEQQAVDVPAELAQAQPRTKTSPAGGGTPPVAAAATQQPAEQASEASQASAQKSASAAEAGDATGKNQQQDRKDDAQPPAAQQQQQGDNQQQGSSQLPAGEDPQVPPAVAARNRKMHKSGRRGRARTKIIRIKMTRRPRVTTPAPPNKGSAVVGRHEEAELAEQADRLPSLHRNPGGDMNPVRGSRLNKVPGSLSSSGSSRAKGTTEEQKLFIVNPQNGVAARPDLAAPDIKTSFQGYNSPKDMISLAQDPGPRKWTSLTITSGSPPFVKGFEKLPRTEKDAVAKGWLPIDDYDCDGEYTNLGRPYMLSEDPAIILLFDKSGYIAGMQTALSESEVWESRDQGNTFKIEDSGYFMQIPINGELHFALTALFVEPEIICSTGRTPDEFDEEGTGTGLYIVVAGIAVKMEMRETDLDKNVWMSGNFFPGMGNHYFAQIDRIGSEDHPVCDDWVPFFLLYNRGYLNAFGWTFFGRYKSSRFEYQSTISYPVFMDPIPQCVEEITSAVGMTTFHILFETFYRNLGFK